MSESNMSDSEGTDDASLELPAGTISLKDHAGNEETCAICLDHIHDLAFTAPCYHKFCFICIYQWFQFQPSCPLCKSPITLFIYDIYSDTEFKTLPVASPTPSRWGNAPLAPPATESTYFPFTSAHERRKRVYQRTIVPALPPSHQPRPGRTSHIRIITMEEWNRRVRVWVEREFQCIMEEHDVSMLLHIFEQLFLRNHGGDLQSPGLFQALTEMLMDYTSVFIRELRCFVESSLNMPTYDRTVRYIVGPS